MGFGCCWVLVGLDSSDKLKKQVTMRSLERLKFEGLDRDKALTDKTSRFYRNPQAFGLHHYTFFQCYQVCRCVVLHSFRAFSETKHGMPFPAVFCCFLICLLLVQCKNPYFGGARQCGANNDAGQVNKEELVCIGCQRVESMEACPTHGTDWLAFKCRYVIISCFRWAAFVSMRVRFLCMFVSVKSVCLCLFVSASAAQTLSGIAGIKCISVRYPWFSFHSLG